jgi:hypothetical protein
MDDRECLELLRSALPELGIFAKHEGPLMLEP